MTNAASLAQRNLCSVSDGSWRLGIQAERFKPLAPFRWSIALALDVNASR
jgi:hypothetical protein